MNFLLAFGVSKIMSKIVGFQSIAISVIFGLVGAFTKWKKVLVSIGAVCTVFFAICYGSNVYNLAKLKGYPDGYYFFGQEQDNIADGKGRLFDENHNIIYYGMFKQNLYHGEGKEYKTYYDELTGEEKTFLEYEGEFYLGFRSGSGKLYDENGKLLYEGGFALGEKCGFGIDYSTDDMGRDKKIIGTFYGGNVNGYYEKYINGELIYKGENIEVIQNKAQYDNNGNKCIEGQYLLGQYTGHVILYYKEDGSKKYNGEYHNDNEQGSGFRYYMTTGILEYEGDFSNGKYHGEGKVYAKLGNLIYEGEFANGQCNGEGKQYD